MKVSRFTLSARRDMLSYDLDQQLVGEDHQRQDRNQIPGKHGDADAIGDQAEQGRHQAGAHIGAGHQDADDGLGPVRPKICRGGVDNAGVDGSAAQAADDEAHQGGGAQRQQHDQDATAHQSLAQANQLRVAELHGQEAAEGTANGNAQEVHAGKACRRLRADALAQRQIAPGPQPGGLLHQT